MWEGHGAGDCGQRQLFRAIAADAEDRRVAHGQAGQRPCIRAPWVLAATIAGCPILIFPACTPGQPWALRVPSRGQASTGRRD